MKKGKNYVVYKDLKTEADIQSIISHYGLEKDAKWSGEQVTIHCPFHQDTRPSCNIGRNKEGILIWHCLGCHESGNVIDFVAQMEDCSFRDAALLIKKQFIASGNEVEVPKTPHRAQKKPKTDEEEHEEGSGVINPPLGFELQVDTAAAIAYAEKRGILPEIAECFGLGIPSKGGYTGRVVIPLHDHNGILVGYAARSVDASEPKYLLPSNKRGFYKSHLLFNLHRVLTGAPKVILLCEGFFDTMKLVQYGYPAVALIGSSLSEEQEKLLSSHVPWRHIVVMMDGDEAGRGATNDCLQRLGKHVYVRAITVPEGKQPDQLEEAEIRLLIHE